MSTVTSDEAAQTAPVQAKPPFLRRVRIRGYKSIAFCDITLEPLTVLVGRNASGKSNFLDALAFVRDALETSIPQAVKRHGGWSAVRSRQPALTPVMFEVEVAVPSPDEVANTAIYGFVLDAGDHGEPLAVREYLSFQDPGSQGRFGFDVGCGGSANGPSPNPQAIGSVASKFLEMGFSRPDRLVLSLWGSAHYHQVAGGLRGSGYYNFHPEAMRQLQRPLVGGLLDRDGSNLPSVIRSVRNTDLTTLERVERYLNSVVPEIEGFGVVSYGEFETVRFRVRGSSGSVTMFDAAAMSDGTLRALGSLMAAYQVHLMDEPAVVGIEEPETALHPAAMRALVDALDEATLRTQILLTTHSAELLDNPTIRPENIRVVEMIDGQTVIGPVDEASVEIVARKLGTLGQLERENQLEPDPDDQERQRRLAQNGEAAPG